MLHSQHTACRSPSRHSNRSLPSLHASCMIVVLFVCCRVFSCVVEKFAAMVSISAVISSYGAAPLMLLLPNTSLTGESYRDLFRDSHIPPVPTTSLIMTSFGSRCLHPHAVLSGFVCRVHSLVSVLAGGWWKIQDNAPVHTAAVVDDWRSETGFGRDANLPHAHQASI